MRRVDIPVLEEDKDGYIMVKLSHLGKRSQGVKKVLEMYIKYLYSVECGGFVNIVKKYDKTKLPTGIRSGLTKDNMAQHKQLIHAAVIRTNNKIRELQGRNLAIYGDRYYEAQELFKDCSIKKVDINIPEGSIDVKLVFRTESGSQEVIL